MKAAVQRGKGRIVVEEIPDPKPGPGEVLVKVAYCGICGSDLHYFTYEHAPSGNVLGHEWSGTVVEVGEGVDGFRVGDRVTMGNIPYWIVEDPPSWLTVKKEELVGLHPVAYAGGFAQYLCYRQDALLRLPDGVTLEQGALTDTLGVGISAVKRVWVRLGSSVAVIGAGPIGLVTIMTSRLSGAGLIVAIEKASARRQAAKRAGADVVLDPSTEDVSQRVMELTGGQGMDVVFEAAGVPSTLQQAVELVKRSGTVGIVGVTFEPSEVLTGIWYIKDVTATVVPGGDLVAALYMMEKGLLDPGPIISHVVPLEQIQEAFKGLLNPTDQLKVLVQP